MLDNWAATPTPDRADIKTKDTMRRIEGSRRRLSSCKCGATQATTTTATEKKREEKPTKGLAFHKILHILTQVMYTSQRGAGSGERGARTTTATGSWQNFDYKNSRIIRLSDPAKGSNQNEKKQQLEVQEEEVREKKIKILNYCFWVRI